MIYVDVWDLQLDIGIGYSVTPENIVGQFLWTVINKMLVDANIMWVKFIRWAEWFDGGFFVKIERVFEYGKRLWHNSGNYKATCYPSMNLHETLSVVKRFQS